MTHCKTIFEELLFLGHDLDFFPRDRGNPTDAPPGSARKLEIMRARVEQGLPVFESDDSTTWLEGDTELKRLTYAARGKATFAELFRPIVDTRTIFKTVTEEDF